MAYPLRFVIIGSGNIACTYVQAFRMLPGVRLVGVVSRSVLPAAPAPGRGRWR